MIRMNRGKLKAMLDRVPKAKTKAHLKNLRKIKKQRIRIAKFAKRKGCFVILMDYTKCMNKTCGAVSGLIRLGCPKCQSLKVNYGVLVNTGRIEKDRFKCAVQQSEFITNNVLFKRIKDGERFLDAGRSAPKEITLKDFNC